jgi:hypothetical protein
MKDKEVNSGSILKIQAGLLHALESDNIIVNLKDGILDAHNLTEDDIKNIKLITNDIKHNVHMDLIDIQTYIQDRKEPLDIIPGLFDIVYRIVSIEETNSYVKGDKSYMPFKNGINGKYMDTVVTELLKYVKPSTNPDTKYRYSLRFSTSNMGSTVTACPNGSINGQCIP